MKNDTANDLGYALGQALVVLLGIIFFAVFIYAVARARRGVKAASADEAARQQAVFEAQRQERIRYLVHRFGEDAARRIYRGEIWQGQNADMLKASLGLPEDVDERVMKASIRHVYKYRPLGKNRYGLRVTLENGVVVGWEEKG